jgi:hypothetical protein
VIARGLDQNDEVLLTAPADQAKLALIRLPGSKVPNGDSAIGDKLPATGDSVKKPDSSHAAPPKGGATEGSGTAARKG